MSATATITGGITMTDSSTSEIYSLQLSTTSASMENAGKREVQVLTTLVTLFTITDPISGSGSFKSLDGVLFINRDSTNFITLGFIVSGSKAFYIKLPPNRSFTMWTKDLDANATGGAFSAFSNLTSVTAKADTATCKLEYLLIHT